MWKRFYPYLAERFYIDLRSLALCRILIGLVLCAYIPHIWINFDTFFSDGGIVPRTIAVIKLSVPSLFPLFFLSDHDLFGRLILVIFWSSAFSLILGYRSRWAAILCWYIYNCLRVRNGVGWHSGDSYLISILFWMFFLPVDAKFSVKPDLTFKGTDRFYSAASMVFILQILISYFFSGLAKINEPWFSGDSLYYAFKVGIYSSKIGQFFSDLPYLRSPLLTITFVLIEILGPFLVLIRLKKDMNRYIFISFFICFHLALVVFMNLDIFPFVCIGALVALLPSRFWSAKENGSAPIFRVKLNPVVSSIAIVGIVLVIASNIKIIDRNTGGLPVKATNFLGLRQNWSLFGFDDVNFGDYWVLVEGILSDGRKVDVFREGQAPLYDKPEYTGDSFKNMFWTKYFHILKRQGYKRYREEFGQYLCRSWNKDHTDLDRLTLVNVKLRYTPIHRSSPPGNRTV